MQSFTRRTLLALAGALAAGPALAQDRRMAGPNPAAMFALLEQSAGGRLGVFVQDVASGRSFGHRQDEAFPLCSTFKLLAAAFVLHRAERGQEDLTRAVPVGRADLVAHSPTVEGRVGGRMSMAELCEAAVTVSDNAAANLLLNSFGGPAGLTGFLRSLGDDKTRLDRIEPFLNEAAAGDPRDSTTPAAMVADLHRLMVADGLSNASKDRLFGWMMGSRTGDRRLRAGLPDEWRVGDKTGTGRNGTTNDVAIVVPPGRPPILIAAYLTASPGPDGGRERVLAEVGRVVSLAL